MSMPEIVAARPDRRGDQRHRHRAAGTFSASRSACRSGACSADARRKRMPAYASGGWADADRIGEQLAAYVAAGGFKAVKMRVGAMDGAPHVSAARVRGGARGNRPRRRPHGRRARHLSPSPRPSASPSSSPTATSPGSRSRSSADDKAGMAEVRAAGDHPDRRRRERGDAFRLPRSCRARAADILQPDLAFCGGITEAMRIGALASAFNLRLAPHLWAGAPGFFAGLHVVRGLARQASSSNIRSAPIR